MRLGYSLFTSAAILASIASPVMAQDQSETGVEETSARGMATAIIVTAERRAQSAQDAPAVVNLVAGDTIDSLKIDDVSKLTAVVPGLKLDGNARDQLRLGLRGAFASGDSPATGQAVGLYVDGIYYAHTTDLGGSLFDVAQVEVLRGPQGTLYGQSVVGGLINIITRDPTDILEVGGSIGIGRFGRRDIRARISGPLTEDLAASFAVSHSRSNGWQRNLTTGNRLDQLDTLSMRMKMAWTPTPELRVRVIGEYSTDNTYGIVRNITFGDPERFAVPDSIRQTKMARDGRYDRETAQIAVTADYELGWATISSITAYQDNHPAAINQSYVTDPEAYFTDDRYGKNHTFSQELRLAGDSGPLRWQFGAFYLRDDVSRRETFDVYAAPGTAFYDFGVRTATNHQDHYINSRSFSLFGQATYDFTDVLALTLGGRYNWDEKASDYRNYGDVNPTVGQLVEEPFRVVQSAKFREFTPKATLTANWDNLPVLDDLLLYGTASRGYISGDIPGGSSVAGSTGVVPPETVWNYEGGFKSTFLDRRATFNVSAFKADYKSLQTLSTSPTGQQGVASTDARVWGVEAEGTLNPFDGLNLTVAYAYLNTKIADGAEAPSGQNVSGNELPQSPEFTWNFLASYSTYVGPDTELSFTGSYSYKDEIYFDVRNDRTALPGILSQTDQRSLDAEVALTHNRWRFALWGKNLTNDQSLMRAFNLSRFTGLTSEELGAGETLFDGVYREPLTYGITIGWEY